MYLLLCIVLLSSVELAVFEYLLHNTALPLLCMLSTDISSIFVLRDN